MTSVHGYLVLIVGPSGAGKEPNTLMPSAIPHIRSTNVCASGARSGSIATPSMQRANH